MAPMLTAQTTRQRSLRIALQSACRSISAPAGYGQHEVNCSTVEIGAAPAGIQHGLRRRHGNRRALSNANLPSPAPQPQAMQETQFDQDIVIGQRTLLAVIWSAGRSLPLVQPKPTGFSRTNGTLTIELSSPLATGSKSMVPGRVTCAGLLVRTGRGPEHETIWTAPGVVEQEAAAVTIEEPALHFRCAF